MPHFSRHFCTLADIWTTRCTRCPAALDKLNETAAVEDGVQFVSICCDKLDGAREILDKEATPRWNFIHHYFMSPDDKDIAKQLLGFKQVPFYMVFSDQGEMLHTGNKLDFDLIPGMKKKVKEEEKPSERIARSPSQVELRKAHDVVSASPSNFEIRKEFDVVAASPDHVFEIDDMDF